MVFSVVLYVIIAHTVRISSRQKHIKHSLRIALRLFRFLLPLTNNSSTRSPSSALTYNDINPPLPIRNIRPRNPPRFVPLHDLVSRHGGVMSSWQARSETERCGSASGCASVVVSCVTSVVLHPSHFTQIAKRSDALRISAAAFTPFDVQSQRFFPRTERRRRSGVYKVPQFTPIVRKELIAPANLSCVDEEAISEGIEYFRSGWD